MRLSSNGKATGRLPVYRSSNLRGRTNLAGRATAGQKCFEEVRDWREGRVGVGWIARHKGRDHRD